MRLRLAWVMGALGAAGAAALAAGCNGTRQPGPRTVELTETVRVIVPKNAGEIRLWIPKPPNTGQQSTDLLGVDSPLPYRITSEPEFGNETLFLRALKPRARVLELRLRYRVTRRPQEATAGPGGPSSPRQRHSGQPSSETLPRAADLRPRGLLTIDEDIRRLAREQTQGLSDPVEKGRALYRYVLGRMRYDKSGQGWGRGDSIYACRVGKGNCTDFHSLFMSLAMASGLPARFRMGLSLAEAPEASVSGYHCWAEFYAQGSGWIPVDISEAWKKPSLKDYYFGHLDASRILVSTGRDIRLSPAQRGPPLNFLSRPYAEADGRPLYDLEFARRYKNVKERI